MKDIKMKGLFGFVGLFFMSFLFTNTVNAHEARTDWYGSCSTPSSNKAYEGTPSYGTSTKYGTEYYHTDHYKSVWSPGYTTGTGRNQVTVPGSYVSVYDYTSHDSMSVSESCGASVSTSGTQYGGTITHRVTYSSYGVSSSTQTHYEYYIIAVDVILSNTYSYVDQSAPVFSCVATYPDGHIKNCTNLMHKSKDQTSGNVRTVCYKYTDNQRTDEECTTRVYVSSVAITVGPNHTYTGLHHLFTCMATFGDGVQKNVSNLNYVWTSSPQNYIGNDYQGHVDPRGRLHTKQGLNDFYPADATGKSYTIKCVYYPLRSPNYSNRWINDREQVVERSTTKTVSHHGIQKMKTEATGYFLEGYKNPTNPTNPNMYKRVADILPSTSTTYYQDYDFIRGHWYDFKTYIMYDDGSKGGGNPGPAGWRDITNAPEVYWTYSPEYENKQAYDTQMSYSGLDHRMSRNGRNTIATQYFHSGSAVNGKTKQQAFAWTHEIVDLKIRGAGGWSSPPKTTVNGDESVTYTAWITWSDEGTNPFGHGQKENWTTGVVWNGDNMTGTGTYKFPRGKGEKRTVYVYYADYENLRGGFNVWDHAFDKLEITINDHCSDNTYLRWGCDVPRVWQTSGYQTPQPNYLPPANLYGYGSWNRDTDPYMFYVEFPVTGISNGVGFD